MSAPTTGPGATEPLSDDRLAKIRDFADIESMVGPGTVGGLMYELLDEIDRLRAQRDLAQELYVRVPIHPLSHVVVRRERAGVDLWGVTDGSLTGLQVWVDGRWQYVGDVGRKAAFRWPLEEALTLAEEAAAAEAHSYTDAVARSKEQQS